jgi:3-hydroxyisobutyrate dehydrogenase
MPETIGFFGAGMLGSGFVQAFCKRGVQVRVWNRTFDRAAALEQYGAKAFRDPAEAAHGAQRVHLCLRSDHAVDETLRKALPGIAPNTPVIDHTTVLPSNVAERVATLAEHNIPFIHAPVFMGPPNAAAATGLMLVSGNSELFQRVRSALEPMTGKVWYVGDRVDKAAIFKLMGNAMILSIVGGIGDMFAIASTNGLTRREAYTLFENYNPAGQIEGRGKRMAESDYEPTWTLEMAHKDAELMLASANELPLPLISAVERALHDAMARGFGNKDLAAIAER